MPYTEKQIQRKYYSPLLAASDFATTTSHLHFIEKELGLVVHQKKRGSQMIRSYSIENLKVIGKVIHAKNLGIPLQVIKRYGVNNLDKIIEFFTGLENTQK
jgi:DNA-binding transcriptional MerR regulator